MSVQLDPREVLAHLNSMGYRNISADILKEFMKSKLKAKLLQKRFISTQKKPFLLDLKRLITYETRYSHQSPNGANAADSPVFLNKNTVQDHFEKLYRTTTEATKARISAKLKPSDKENDDPYDPYKFDRIRVDEGNVREWPKKQCKIENQQKRTNQNTVPVKSCDNGKFFYYTFGRRVVSMQKTPLVSSHFEFFATLPVQLRSDLRTGRS